MICGGLRFRVSDIFDRGRDGCGHNSAVRCPGAYQAIYHNKYVVQQTPLSPGGLMHSSMDFDNQKAIFRQHRQRNDAMGQGLHL